MDEPPNWLIVVVPYPEVHQFRIPNRISLGALGWFVPTFFRIRLHLISSSVGGQVDPSRGMWTTQGKRMRAISFPSTIASETVVKEKCRALWFDLSSPCWPRSRFSLSSRVGTVKNNQVTREVIRSDARMLLVRLFTMVFGFSSLYWV